MAGEIDGLPLYLGHGFLTFSEAGRRAGWHPGSRPARWWRAAGAARPRGGVPSASRVTAVTPTSREGALLRLVAGWSATSIIWLRRRCCPAGSRAPREPMWL